MIKEKPKSKKLPVAIWIIAGIILMGIFVMAISYTDTGARDSSGNLISSRTADVVVCRGTSLADDIIKSFQCDVVCKSTDNDCADDIRNVVSSNKVVFLKGNFPLVSKSGRGFINLDRSNFSLIGVNANLYPVYVNDNTIINAAIYINDSKNIVVDGINIFGNSICSSSTFLCRGLTSIDSNDVLVKNVRIEKVKGFQFTIEGNMTFPSNNVIDSSYGVGTCTNDVIGGGQIVSSKVINSIAIQNNGMDCDYLGGIVLTNSSNVLISNNYVEGFVSFSSETGGSFNNIISNNVIHQTVRGTGGGVIIFSALSKNNLISNNNIVHGGITLYGDQNSVLNNVINPSFTGIIVWNNSNIIQGNSVLNHYGSGSYDFDIKGKNNIINNNVISGGFRAFNFLGDYNSAQYNVISNINGSDVSSSIISSVGQSTVFDYNTIYLNSVNTLGYVFVAEHITNSSFSFNKIYNDGRINNYYNVFGNNNNFDSNVVQGISPLNHHSTYEGAFYLNDFPYSGSLTQYNVCSYLSFFNGKIISNSTTSCTCTGGSWKCWGMT